MDWNKVKKIVLNKYFIATVAFLAIILVFDRYSLIVSSRIGREVRQLHNEEQQLRDAIAEDSIKAAALKNNLDAKERYGRENYYMKRANEDIYVVK